MWILFKSYIIIVFIFLGSIVFSAPLWSAPVCGGTFSCFDSQDYCSHSNGTNVGCDPLFDDLCLCTSSCTSSSTTFPCSTLSSCSLTSADQFCLFRCPFNPIGSRASYSCSVTPDACTSNPDCGPNRRCCGGSPNYCSNSCYDCAGNYICSPPTSTPTPTPTPVPACTSSGPCSAVSPSCTGGSADVTFNWTRNGSGNEYELWWTGSGGSITVGDTSSYSSTGFTPNTSITFNVRAYRSNNTCAPGPTCSTTITTRSSCTGPTAVPTSTPIPTRTPTPGPTTSGATNTPVPTSSAPTPTPTGASCESFGGVSCGGSCCYSPMVCRTGWPMEVCEEPVTCNSLCQVPWPGNTCYDTCPQYQQCGYYGCTNILYPLSGTIYNDANGNGAWDITCYIDQDDDGQQDAGEGVLSGNSTSCQVAAEGSTVSACVPYDDSSCGASKTCQRQMQDANCGNVHTITVSEGRYPYGVSVQVGGTTKTSDANGRFTGEAPAGPTTVRALPGDYDITSTNPVTINMPDENRAVFGVRRRPACNGALTASPSTVNPGSTSTVSITDCNAVENPSDPLAPPPFDWDPPTDDNPTNSGDPECSDGLNNDGTQGTDIADPDCHTDGDAGNPDTYNPRDDSESSGSNTCRDAGMSPSTDTDNSSTVDWTAPVCPTSNLTCPVNVTVNGGVGSGTTTYSTNITVTRTQQITTNIRLSSDTTTCSPTSGTPLVINGDGVEVINNYSGTNSIVTSNTSTGVALFACLRGGLTYTITPQIETGYAVVGRSGGANVGTNSIRFTNLGANQTATFCIAPVGSWYQTDLGNIRYSRLTNPIPGGKVGSTDTNFPGIYYSSKSTAQFGLGSASSKNWVVNNEFLYNAQTENRNGGLSYSFFKSKIQQDGVTTTPLNSTTFLQSDLNTSSSYVNNNAGVFERNGNLTINSYTHVNGKRVVLLVNGDVTINTPIAVGNGQGLFIIAASGNITINKTIGTTTLTSTATQLDGYYSAQGSIILEGDRCADGTTPDRRLNVGGVIVANSLKPFSTTGAGSIQNSRSLCSNNLQYPALYVASRPDFLVKLTDFYKTSYTKWSEENP